MDEKDAVTIASNVMITKAAIQRAKILQQQNTILREALELYTNKDNLRVDICNQLIQNIDRSLIGIDYYDIIKCIYEWSNGKGVEFGETARTALNKIKQTEGD